MTLEALRTLVRELTDTGLSELFSDTSLDQMLNMVLAEVWAAEAWPFAYKLADLAVPAGGGPQAVPLPADCRRLDTVRLLAAGGQREDRLLVPRSEEPIGWLPVDCEPEEYAVEPTTGELRVWPTPEAGCTLRVRYVSAPPTLAAGEQVPGLPAEYHTMLAYGAAVRVLDAQTDETTQRRARYQEDYESALALMSSTLVRGNLRPFVMGNRRRARGGWRR